MTKLLKQIINISKLFIIIFLLSNSSQTYADSRVSQIKGYQKNTLYFGHFQELPATNFCVLYDGELIDLHDACFTIKDITLGAVNLLFVDPEKIKFVTEDSNTVLSLNLETKDYKYYQLEIIQIPAINTPANEPATSDYISSWNICEKTISNKIPFNTIVIPLNPSTLEIKLQNVTGKPNNLAIKLPEIKLLSKCGQTLKELMIEGYLKAISLKPFHAKQRVTSNVKNGTKISMIL
jgi:hypothetical protein